MRHKIFTYALSVYQATVLYWTGLDWTGLDLLTYLLTYARVQDII